jgi:hypothetical protein
VSEESVWILVVALRSLLVTLAGRGLKKYGDLETYQMCTYTSTPPFTVSKGPMYMYHKILILLLISVSYTLYTVKYSKINLKMPPKPRLNVQNFPRPPLLERTSRHLQIKWHGQTIADTKEAYWVLETYHAPSISAPIPPFHFCHPNNIQPTTSPSRPFPYPWYRPRNPPFVNGKAGQPITLSRGQS